MRRRLAVVAPFAEDDTFYSHMYWDEPLGYFVSNDRGKTRRALSNLIKDKLTWGYVQLDFPEEFAVLDTPSNRLDTHMMMINADGNASYMCFAEDTGEEYATEGFNLKKILSDLG